MKATDAIRIGLELTELDLHFIEDMRHAPLTRPMPNGGNHPWWLIGHLTWAEGNVIKIIRGEPNPVERWASAVHVGNRARCGRQRLSAIR